MVDGNGLEKPILHSCDAKRNPNYQLRKRYLFEARSKLTAICSPHSIEGLTDT
jgi:hypothetical protein